MYGKIFASIYDGTLADNWQALVTFEQMIVLCDADGVLDMTAAGLSRRTGIPLEIIQEGIRFLELPDRQSKSDVEEGRRITRLDAHRDWGWKLVNHAYYKGLVDADTVREQNRVRQQRMREKRRDPEATEQVDLLDGVTVRHGASRCVTEDHAESRHTDTDTNTTDTDTSSPVDRIFFLWKTTYEHPRAKLDDKRRKKIIAALKLGYSVEELCHAIGGYKFSPHHMGKNETSTIYDDLELYLRDAAHIDKGLQLWEQSKQGNPDSQGPGHGVLA